ncbi:MAG: hypothetical protein PUA90_05030 [bacterium]|nr:hypothetical protein [bacterium]
MTSEVDNILKGRVEATVEFVNSKKVIGISSAHLTPKEDGVVPLSKQGAFIVNKEEQTAQIETLDFSDTPKESGNTDSEEVKVDAIPGLKTPEFTDVVVDAPLEVTSPKELSDFNVTASSEVVEKQEPQTTIEDTIGTIDIQMPQMPDTIIAEEPKEVNEQLFEIPRNDNPINDIPNDSKEVSTPDTLNESLSNNVVNTVEESPIAESLDVDALVEQKRKELMDEIDKKIKAYLSEIKEIYNHGKLNNSTKVESNDVKEVQTQENPVMNDALAQINNMVIPGDNGLKL